MAAANQSQRTRGAPAVLVRGNSLQTRKTFDEGNTQRNTDAKQNRNKKSSIFSRSFAERKTTMFRGGQYGGRQSFRQDPPAKRC